MSDIFDQFCEICLDKTTLNRKNKSTQIFNFLENTGVFIKDTFGVLPETKNIFVHPTQAVAITKIFFRQKDVSLTTMPIINWQAFDFEKKQVSSLWIKKKSFLFSRSEIGQKLPVKNIFYSELPSVIYNKYHEILYKNNFSPKEVSLYQSIDKPGKTWARPIYQLSLFDDLYSIKPIVKSWTAYNVPLAKQTSLKANSKLSFDAA